MARPVHKLLQDEGWDAAANDNFDKVFSTPLPPARYVSTGALPDANDYDGCVAEVDNVGLYISENGVWRPVPRQGSTVADVAGPLTATTTFGEVDTHLETLRAKINALLAEMRSSDHIET